jgi:hypothetical protein
MGPQLDRKKPASWPSTRESGPFELASTGHLYFTHLLYSSTFLQLETFRLAYVDAYVESFSKGRLCAGKSVC